MTQEKNVEEKQPSSRGRCHLHSGTALSGALMASELFYCATESPGEILHGQQSHIPVLSCEQGCSVSFEALWAPGATGLHLNSRPGDKAVTPCPCSYNTAHTTKQLQAPPWGSPAPHKHCISEQQRAWLAPWAARTSSTAAPSSPSFKFSHCSWQHQPQPPPPTTLTFFTPSLKKPNSLYTFFSPSFPSPAWFFTVICPEYLTRNPS